MTTCDLRCRALTWMGGAAILIRPPQKRVILRGNFSYVFQQKNATNIFVSCSWHFPTKSSPQNFLRKKSAEFSEKFPVTPPIFFWATDRRPTNLGAAGEASSAAGVHPLCALYPDSARIIPRKKLVFYFKFVRHVLGIRSFYYRCHAPEPYFRLFTSMRV